MDLPVVLIKLRDYIFWFGPPYLLAICLGATAEVILGRLLRLPSSGQNSAPEAGLLYSIWCRQSGQVSGPCRLPLYLCVWLNITSQGLSWVALLTTAALSVPLSLLRLGSVLVLASILAALTPFLAGRKRERSLRGLLVYRSPERSEQLDHPEQGQALPLHLEWWRMVSYRFSKSSNGLLAGAVFGAAIIGLAPSLYSFVDKLLASPLSYVTGAAVGLGLALPIGPGTDAPLLAALQTKGVDISVLLGIMLGVAASRPEFVKLMYKAYDRKVVLLYLLVAWLASATVGWLVTLAITAMGATYG